MKDNKEYFSTLKIQGVDEARKVKQKIGWPRNSHFKDIVPNQLLQNCKVTVDDIITSELIYGSLNPIYKEND